MAEIRDPIHQFIHLSDLEVGIIDTRPVQRLREIHQLSTGFLIWPGAVHTRFEHALGTMELAGRAFEAAIRNTSRDNPAILVQLGWDQEPGRERARSFVRLAALLHDVGHSPFSHGPESLFPEYEADGNKKRVTHEHMSARIILETEIGEKLQRDQYHGVDPEVIAYIAVGPEHRPRSSDERTLLLTELVTGSVGVDRWDYLLRDSLFSGSRYGLFDIERMIESLIIIESKGSPAWALKAGGQYSAEQMLLARWFMWLNVYTHKTRRILDKHLEHFLKDFLDGESFPTIVEDYLEITDRVILTEIRKYDEHRSRLLERGHFRQVREFSRKEFTLPDLFQDFSKSLGPSVICDDFVVNPSPPRENEFYVLDSESNPVPMQDVLPVVGMMKSRWFGRVYAPIQRLGQAETMVENTLSKKGAQK